MSEARLELADIIRNTHELSAAKGWSPMSPMERLASVRAELREVEEAVEQLVAVAAGAAGQPHASTVDEARGHLGEEVFDVIWNLCELTEGLGVDLVEACLSKMADNATRTWGRSLDG